MVLDNLLERLAAFEPNGFPVISLYLDTRPDQHGRDNYQAFVRKELAARGKTFPTASSERESYDRDADRIHQYLAEELPASANGVVIFACAGADLFEKLELEAPIGEHRLYVQDQPHLYQLARLNDEYPRYAAVIADTNQARLFVFGLGRTLGQQEVQGTKTRSTKAGGWSQARYRRHIEHYHAQHAKEVIDALERTVREENIGHIVLAGDENIIPKLREQLPRQLEEKIIDVLRLDIRAPENEVLAATLSALREQDAKDDAEKVNRLLQEFRAGGLAVAGPEDTLQALEIGQVDELLLSVTFEQQHGDGDEARKLADELVTKAAQTSARVSFIEDGALLAEISGAGAFLRYMIGAEGHS